MQNILLINVLLVSILLSGCQNKSNPSDEHEHAGESMGHDSASHHDETHAVHTNLVKLNNGDKWSANTETTQGIKNMTTLIETFPEKPTLEDFHALKVK